MPKVTFVKKARKDYPPNIKKGEPYYHWAFMCGGRGGPVIRSAKKPKRSQLTQSAFKSQLYGIQDGASEATPSTEDLEGERDSIRDELDSLKGECEGNLENMPDGLKEGDTGQMLQTRIDSLEEAISALENVGCICDPEDKDEGQSEDEYKEAWAMEKWQEVIDALDNIDEG